MGNVGRKRCVGGGGSQDLLQPGGWVGNVGRKRFFFLFVFFCFFFFFFWGGVSQDLLQPGGWVGNVGRKRFVFFFVFFLGGGGVSGPLTTRWVGGECREKTFCFFFCFFFFFGGGVSQDLLQPGGWVGNVGRKRWGEKSRDFLQPCGWVEDIGIKRREEREGRLGTTQKRIWL